MTAQRLHQARQLLASATTVMNAAQSGFVLARAGVGGNTLSNAELMEHIRTLHNTIGKMHQVLTMILDDMDRQRP